jgi:hypothetical protein
VWLLHGMTKLHYVNWSVVPLKLSGVMPLHEKTMLIGFLQPLLVISTTLKTMVTTFESNHYIYFLNYDIIFYHISLCLNFNWTSDIQSLLSGFIRPNLTN